LIGVLVFAVGPMVFVVALSLMRWDGFGAMEFVGLSNYVDQFRSPDLWISLRNTAYYTVLTVPGALVVGLLVATGVNKVRGKTFYRLLYFMPAVTSPVAVAVVWITVLNGDYGLLNGTLQSLFGIQGPSWLTDARFVIPAIALLGIWLQLGYNMVLFLAGLQSIPASYSEAARIDGANSVQVFWYVTLPLLSPTILFVTVITMIVSLQVFDQAFVMTNGGPDKASYTMVFHLYQLAFVDFRFGASSAAALVLFAVILVLTLLQLWFQRRWVHYDD